MGAVEIVNNNTVKQQYFLNLCHDIRAPLNVIMGMTSLAWTELEDKDKIMNRLSRIETTSNYLLELVNDILDLSKIDNGKMAIHHEEFSLYQLINFITTMIELQTDQKQQKFETKLTDVTDGNLVGDFLRLNQILMNLLTNAVKYTAVAGTIKLDIRQIRRDPKCAIMEFQVSDTGIGMSEEFIERMFEPFTQAGDCHSKERNTSGLGLYITKNLVTLMEGAIRVMSQPKIGTTITVQIPFGLPAESKSRQLPKFTEKYMEEKDDKSLHLNDFDFSCKRVLVVEDNVDSMEITVEMLKQTGIAIECAQDGVAAVQLFEESATGYYDAILMDVMMPKMNGLIATEKIRSSNHPNAKGILIIAMTGNAFSEDATASWEAGMDKYVTKPINYIQLFKLLDESF